MGMEAPLPSAPPGEPAVAASAAAAAAAARSKTSPKRVETVVRQHHISPLASSPQPTVAHTSGGAGMSSPQQASLLLQQQKLWQAESNRLKLLLKEKDEAYIAQREEAQVLRQVAPCVVSISPLAAGRQVTLD